MPDLTGPVSGAFQALSAASGSDWVEADRLLRPWLEARAESRIRDPAMAVLVSQQVLVDMQARHPREFASPQDFGQWLEVRVVQTAALFTGAISTPQPLAMDAAPGFWRGHLGAILGLPLLSNLHRFSSISVLAGATVLSAAVTGLAAVAITGAISYSLYEPPGTPLPSVHSPVGVPFAAATRTTPSGGSASAPAHPKVTPLATGRSGVLGTRTSVRPRTIAGVTPLPNSHAAPGPSAPVNPSAPSPTEPARPSSAPPPVHPAPLTPPPPPPSCARVHPAPPHPRGARGEPASGTPPHPPAHGAPGRLFCPPGSPRPSAPTGRCRPPAAPPTPSQSPPPSCACVHPAPPHPRGASGELASGTPPHPPAHEAPGRLFCPPGSPRPSAPTSRCRPPAAPSTPSQSPPPPAHQTPSEEPTSPESPRSDPTPAVATAPLLSSKPSQLPEHHGRPAPGVPDAQTHRSRPLPGAAGTLEVQRGQPGSDSQAHD